MPAAKAVALPDGFPVEWAPLVEPVACAVHGFDMLDLRLGDHILIYGAGTMGLILCQLAAARAAGSVSVVDPNRDRLLRAVHAGADFAMVSADELGRPDGFEVVIDATGVVPAIEDGLRRVARGGTLLLFGVAAPDAAATFSPFRVYRDEIRIIGSMAILHSFERARDLVAAGAIDGDALLTHRFALDDYDAAVRTFRGGEDLKILVTPQV